MQLALVRRNDVAHEVRPTARRLHLVPPPPRQRHRDPRPIAANFARGVAEVMAHVRSVDQLRDLATWEVVRIIERAAGRQASHLQRPVLRPHVRSVHLTTPCDGVIEACAVIDGNARARALAFRLESRGTGWRCTIVQFG